MGPYSAITVAGFSDAWITAQNQFHDLHPYHPNYMIAPEVTDEFSLLDNFLHTSLLDEGTQQPDAPSNNRSPASMRANQADMISNLLSQATTAGGGYWATRRNAISISCRAGCLDPDTWKHGA